jgi:CO/xanthine dehydrogenase Mo-binding subunit
MTRVVRFWASHDPGRIVHRAAIEGQVEGGVVQGMGWALMEHLRLDHGKVLNPGFTDYLIPTSLDAPPIEMSFIERPYAAGPYGAKGIGEPSLIPAPAAVAAAIRDATGLDLPFLPITPERLLVALRSSAAR